MTMTTVWGKVLPVFGFCLALGLHGQQSVPNENQLRNSVPRLVRISSNFHPANGLASSPVEGVTLSIYRDETGGTPLWQETQNVSVDGEGRYTVMMGSTLADGVPLELFTSSAPRWLGVQFQRQGEPEQPRVRLASVPYALKAVDAETLGGRPASAYLLNPAVLVGDTPASPGKAAGTLNTLRPKVDSGTTNCIAAFTSATDVGCSPMWQSGTSVGVNTASPGATLDVQSNATGFAGLLNIRGTNGAGVGAAGVTLSQQNASMLMRAYTPGAPGLLSNSIGWFALNGSNKLFIGHAGGSVGNDVQFFTNNQWNNPQLTLTKAGNFGVGTSTGLSRLTVRGTPAFTVTGTVTTDGTSTVTGTGTSFLSEVGVGDRVQIPSGGATFIVRSVVSDTSLTLNVGAAAGTGQSMKTFPSLLRTEVSTPNSGSDFLITDQGNVQIGGIVNQATRLFVSAPDGFTGTSTTSPAGAGVGESVAAFAIRGTTNAAANEGPMIALSGNTGTTTGVFAGVRGAKENASSDFNGCLAFYTTQNGSPNTFAERVRISSGGNVGIGTTNPTANLHVATGDIYVSNPGSGIILKSPDGMTCARLSLDNSGTAITTIVGCP